MKQIILLAKLLLLSTTWFLPYCVQGQDTLTIAECQKLAEKNYPLLQNKELILQSSKYSVSNITSGYLPSVTIYGQYSTQSDVTKIPLRIPEMTIPEIEKEQYKVFAEVNQVIYDAGLISGQRKLAEAQYESERENLEVELYKIKERVSQIFFGILLLDGQISQLNLLLSDLDAGLKKSETAYTNGTLLKSNYESLKAEILKTQQKKTELLNAKEAYIEALSLFINQPIKGDIVLLIPDLRGTNSNISRPELDYFRARSTVMSLQNRIINSKNLPKLNVFLNAGYGSPALNMLDPNSDTYYIAGLKFIWPFSGLYNLSREKSLNKISIETIANQQETFLLNTRIQIAQQNREIQKYKNLLETDDEIIQLRENVAEASLKQLENGVITTSDYVREVNAADNARQSRIIHQIHLSMAQYNFNLITGNN